MPASPSRAETSPSCMTPLPDSVGSSSCSAMIPPASFWYCSALRRMPARCTGLPSSVKPSAPAWRSSAISVSASPCRPRVTRREEADGDARLAAGGLAQRAQDRRGVDDRVGVRHRHDGDEAAGGRGARAGVEVLLVLLPGYAQVHVRVDEAREEVPALAVDRLAVVLERVGLGQLGDHAVLDAHVARASMPCAGRARGRRGSAGRRAAWACGRALMRSPGSERGWDAVALRPASSS